VTFRFSTICLVLVAITSFGTAFAHLACIPIGTQCYSAQMAPEIIIESAEQGTYLAPLATVFVSSIFVIFGLYSLSGAGGIRKLPLLKFGVYSIALLCTIRGVLPLQFWLRYPDEVGSTAILYGIGWLLSGLLLFFGYYNIQKSAYNKFVNKDKF